jgi:hypothetical protein
MQYPTFDIAKVSRNRVFEGEMAKNILCMR